MPVQISQNNNSHDFDQKSLSTDPHRRYQRVFSKGRQQQRQQTAWTPNLRVLLCRGVLPMRLPSRNQNSIDVIVARSQIP